MPHKSKSRSRSPRRSKSRSKSPRRRYKKYAKYGAGAAGLAATAGALYHYRSKIYDLAKKVGLGSKQAAKVANVAVKQKVASAPARLGASPAYKGMAQAKAALLRQTKSL